VTVGFESRHWLSFVFYKLRFDAWCVGEMLWDVLLGMYDVCGVMLLSIFVVVFGIIGYCYDYIGFLCQIGYLSVAYK
jgi:hypothetical protein